MHCSNPAFGREILINFLSCLVLKLQSYRLKILTKLIKLILQLQINPAESRHEWQKENIDQHWLINFNWKIRTSIFWWTPHRHVHCEYMPLQLNGILEKVLDDQTSFQSLTTALSQQYISPPSVTPNRSDTTKTFLFRQSFR